MNVICVKKVLFVDNGTQDIDEDTYQVGKIYKSKFFREKQLIQSGFEKEYFIEYEWSVYCSDHNYYQFTNAEFSDHFINIAKYRDTKIENLLN